MGQDICCDDSILSLGGSNKNGCSKSIITILFNLFRPFGFFLLPIFVLWAYLMKVILSIPDEGYSEHTWWRLFWAYLMKVILSIPDEGYSEHTWWSLFWAYLMKLILSIPDEGYSRKLFMGTKLDLYVLLIIFDYQILHLRHQPLSYLGRKGLGGYQGSLHEYGVVWYLGIRQSVSFSLNRLTQFRCTI